MKKSIIIADDHPIFRNGLKQVLSGKENITLIGEAKNGSEALKLIEEQKPDAAILDLDMPLLSGLQVLEKVKRMKSETRIILLTMYKEEKLFNRAFDFGAYAFVLKDSAVEDIEGCIDAVLAGEYFVSPGVSSFLIGRSSRKKDFDDNFDSVKTLTEMERKVIKLISQSKSSKDISDELFISVRTVDKHRENICGKLNLKGNLSLTKFAIENKSFL